MIDIKQFISAIDQIAEEKGIDSSQVKEVIEQALAAAYKKDYGERGQSIKVELDVKSGKAEFFQSFLVVSKDMLYTEEELEEMETERLKKQEELSSTETSDNKQTDKKKEQIKKEDDEGDDEEKKIRFNDKRHMLLVDAKKIRKNVKVEEEVLVKLENKDDFGRIAAQTAKQVIIQRIREAERNATYESFKEKEDEIVSGIVQRIERNLIYLDIGRTTGVIFPEEQIPHERYRQGQRVRVYVVRVEKDPKGPVIVLSRRHPRIVSKLFELEVPELAAGIVEIKAIAREAGSRSKIAVSSNDDSIDPVGSCVGQKGIRVSAVINELGGENIDIIAWDENPEIFVANALSPAKIINVDLDEKTNTAIVDVREDQLSLAIGRLGQNVRLAAKLTGWKIDVQGSEKALKEEGVSEEEHKEEIAKVAEAGADKVGEKSETEESGKDNKKESEKKSEDKKS